MSDDLKAGEALINALVRPAKMFFLSPIVFVLVVCTCYCPRVA